MHVLDNDRYSFIIQFSSTYIFSYINVLTRAWGRLYFVSWI